MGWPWASMMQPSGTGTPLLKATLSFPSATDDVEISKMIGSPPATGMPAATGLADNRRLMPPTGATKRPRPLVLTKCSETRPGPDHHLGPMADAAHVPAVAQGDRRRRRCSWIFRCPASSPARRSTGPAPSGHRRPRWCRSRKSPPAAGWPAPCLPPASGRRSACESRRANRARSGWPAPDDRPPPPPRAARSRPRQKSR